FEQSGVIVVPGRLAAEPDPTTLHAASGQAVAPPRAGSGARRPKRLAGWLLGAALVSGTSAIVMSHADHDAAAPAARPAPPTRVPSAARTPAPPTAPPTPAPLAAQTTSPPAPPVAPTTPMPAPPTPSTSAVPASVAGDVAEAVATPLPPSDAITARAPASA